MGGETVEHLLCRRPCHKKWIKDDSNHESMESDAACEQSHNHMSRESQASASVHQSCFLTCHDHTMLHKMGMFMFTHVHMRDML